MDDTPALEVDVATVRAVISRWRSKRGTAPGLTGLTPEHLVAAPDASDDTLSAISYNEDPGVATASASVFTRPWRFPRARAAQARRPCLIMP